MQVFTITLQFRVKADDRAEAERLAGICEILLAPVIDTPRSGVIRIFPPEVHFFTNLHEGE
ncbi:MAG: hypothetical protein COA89_12725 [Acidithiobacillus sp.]|jgi:hypothetical protein|nr:MAG: hypothetical protein COA89_12725 [Acidithiobacillus sp.]